LVDLAEFIPDPGGIKAPDPGSATLLGIYKHCLFQLLKRHRFPIRKTAFINADPEHLSEVKIIILQVLK
jgi:hypothetical protein